MKQELATTTQSNYADLSRYLVVQTDANEMQEILAENVGNGQLSIFDLEKISVPAGGATSWHLLTVSGEAEVKEITAIIVGMRDFRSYWKISYDESGGGTPPDCSAPPPIGNEAQFGLGDPGGECDLCPMNVYGSSIKGEGKACKEIRALYLLQADTLIPSVLFVPPSSLKPVKKYCLGLAAKGLRYFSVLTSFTLRKEKSNNGISYSQIVPRMVDALAAEDVARLAEYVGVMKTGISGHSSHAMGTVVADSPREPTVSPDPVA